MINSPTMKAHDQKISEKILKELSEKFPASIPDFVVWSNNFRDH
jgi:hypothetical protein